MKNKKYQKHIGVVVLALLGTTFVYTTTLFINSHNLANIKRKDPLYAATECDSSFFTINNSYGYSFTPGCMQVQTTIYETDTRFTFAHTPRGPKRNYVKTENVNIKNLNNLDWNISLNEPANVYVSFRRTRNPAPVPSWIDNTYTKITPDTLTNNNLHLFIQRWNQQQQLGLYDTYKKNQSIQGTIHFGNAADQPQTALSMYIVEIEKVAVATIAPTAVPTSTATPRVTNSPAATQTPRPTSTPRPTATPRPTVAPTSNGRPTPPPNLVTELQNHATASNCWTMYYSPSQGWHLYNVTIYVGLHPGGSDRIKAVCGKDMTDLFDDTGDMYGVSGHKHKSEAFTIRENLRVPGY